jgi:hypothetical protein
MRWISQNITVNHKTERKAVYSKVLARFAAGVETFLFRTITRDKTRAHHFELGTKRQSMEWHHPQSPGEIIKKVSVTRHRHCLLAL